MTRAAPIYQVGPTNAGPESSVLPSPPYRADVDGLRAVAVLAVIAYHSFPLLCPSGYTGVDVFFVISGFLITGLLTRWSGDFPSNLAAFYGGRIRRLFPALIVVTGATLLLSWFLLLPLELENLGSHLIAGATFTSNIQLWNESGYFDSIAELKPLRMLWSLGVEEQFYLIWPFVITLARWRGVRLRSVIWVIAGISFAFSLDGSLTDDPAAFFSPLSRFWELAIGAYLAQREGSVGAPYAPWSLHIPKFRRELGAFLGAGLVVCGFFIIPTSAHFPGLWACLPVFGTALILYSGPASQLNRYLANRALVSIGLISYPLYLWHWPLLSLPRIVFGSTPAAYVRAGADVIAVFLAYGTYRLLERPIRSRRNRLQIVLLLVGVVFVGLSGYACVTTKGFPSRIAVSHLERVAGPIAAPALQEYFRIAESEYFPCMPPELRVSAPTWQGHVRCFQSKSGVPVDLAIVGDSHAEHLFVGLARSMPQRNVALYMRQALPFIGEKSFGSIFAYLLSQPRIRVVILSGFWPRHVPEASKFVDFKAVMSLTVLELTRTGKDVYLTGDTPNFSFDASHCKFRRPLNSAETCMEDSNYFASQQSTYLPGFQEIVAENHRAHLLNLSQFFCDKQFCNMAPEGKILFRDREHLNVMGSQYVGDSLVKAYPQLLQ